VTLNGQREARDPSLGVQLLRDSRTIFDRLGVDRITSADLADHLVAIEGAPWADLRGNPIDAQGVAKRLRPYEVRPGSHWFGDGSGRGYLREDLYDAWQRYLPPAVARDSRDSREEPPPEPPDPPGNITGPRGGSDPECADCDQPATCHDRDGQQRCARCVSWADGAA